MELVSFILCDEVNKSDFGYNFVNANRTIFWSDNFPFEVQKMAALITFRRLSGEQETQDFSFGIFSPVKINLIKEPKKFARFIDGSPLRSWEILLDGLMFPEPGEYKFVIRYSNNAKVAWGIYVGPQPGVQARTQ